MQRQDGPTDGRDMPAEPMAAWPMGMPGSDVQGLTGGSFWSQFGLGPAAASAHQPVIGGESTSSVVRSGKRADQPIRVKPEEWSKLHLRWKRGQRDRATDMICILDQLLPMPGDTPGASPGVFRLVLTDASSMLVLAQSNLSNISQVWAVGQSARARLHQGGHKLKSCRRHWTGSARCYLGHGWPWRTTQELG